MHKLGTRHVFQGIMADVVVLMNKTHQIVHLALGRHAIQISLAKEYHEPKYNAPHIWSNLSWRKDLGDKECEIAGCKGKRRHTYIAP